MLSGRFGAPRPDVVAYDAAMSACERGRAWSWALQLFEDLRPARLEPTLITYNTAISACDKASRWAQALALLAASGQCGQGPSVVGFGAALSACTRAERWLLGLSLLDQMRQHSIRANAVMSGITTALVPALAAARRGEARVLLKRGPLHPHSET
mmetsp:Transcript_85716/g.260170  ORF Transcript_85716/g.260170 Transcript_85716/m.260170 type:complete len:155 (-) Transcript_85716:62-526(-)